MADVGAHPSSRNLNTAVSRLAGADLGGGAGDAEEALRARCRLRGAARGSRSPAYVAAGANKGEKSSSSVTSRSGGAGHELHLDIHEERASSTGNLLDREALARHAHWLSGGGGASSRTSRRWSSPIAWRGTCRTGTEHARRARLSARGRSSTWKSMWFAITASNDASETAVLDVCDDVFGAVADHARAASTMPAEKSVKRSRQPDGTGRCSRARCFRRRNRPRARRRRHRSRSRRKSSADKWTGVREVLVVERDPRPQVRVRRVLLLEPVALAHASPQRKATNPSAASSAPPARRYARTSRSASTSAIALGGISVTRIRRSRVSWSGASSCHGSHQARGSTSLRAWSSAIAPSSTPASRRRSRSEPGPVAADEQ